MSAKPELPQKIRVMLVEDHILMRVGLKTTAEGEPDMEVVAEVADGRQVLDSFRAHKPDVVLLDLRLPGMDGLQIIKLLRQENPDARIVILSSYGGGDDITRAIQSGASGYVLKSMPLEQMLQAVRVVKAGGQYFPREISDRVNQRIQSDISSREIEVLRLIAQGNANKEIGAKLGISEGTVKNHLTHIFTKLGAADRAQALTIAVKRQLIQLE
ncbi:MAG: response regulator transcription factor [Verrucomicrobiota bacterium]